MKEKIKKIYSPLGDDWTEEESKYNGKTCYIIEKLNDSWDYRVEFENGHKMPVNDIELKDPYIKLKINEVKLIDNGKYRKMRIYIFREGETLLQNILQRYTRPYDFYKKEVIPKIKDQLKEEGIDLDTLKISWNQYAGCSCGCSPGFILNLVDNREIFVTISEETEVKA